MTDRVNSYRNICFNFVAYNHCTYFGSNGSGRTRSNNERNENRTKFPHYEKNQKIVFKPVLSKRGKKSISNHNDRRTDSRCQKTADGEGFNIGEQKLHCKDFTRSFSALGKKEGGSYQLSKITDHI